MRILSMVALASLAVLSPTADAKDKDGGGKGKGGGGGGSRAAAPQRGGGGGGGNRAAVQSRPQMRVGGGNNIARVQPNRPSQIQRYKAPQVKRSSPSVALTGRSAAQERGANWNERRRKLIQQQYRAERREDRRDYWEDRHDDWNDHHDDWDDDHHHYYVPYDTYRYWDHDRIYTWNNNRYRWYNNAWVVISPGLNYGYNDGYYYGSGGSSGSLAADVQMELARRGYNPGPVDGVIGRQTRDAIADFQRDEGLPVTGRIDTAVVRELGL